MCKMWCRGAPRMCYDPGISGGLEPPEEDGLCSCPACLNALQEARQASTCFSDAIRALQVSLSLPCQLATCKFVPHNAHIDMFMFSSPVDPGKLCRDHPRNSGISVRQSSDLKQGMVAACPIQICESPCSNQLLTSKLFCQSGWPLQTSQSKSESAIELSGFDVAVLASLFENRCSWLH